MSKDKVMHPTNSSGGETVKLAGSYPKNEGPTAVQYSSYTKKNGKKKK